MSNFTVGDQVFWKCTNPAVGLVTRVAKDSSWADVLFLGYKKASRVKTEYLGNACFALNYWMFMDKGETHLSNKQILFPNNQHDSKLNQLKEAKEVLSSIGGGCGYINEKTYSTWDRTQMMVAASNFNRKYAR